MFHKTKYMLGPPTLGPDQSCWHSSSPSSSPTLQSGSGCHPWYLDSTSPWDGPTMALGYEQSSITIMVHQCLTHNRNIRGHHFVWVIILMNVMCLSKKKKSISKIKWGGPMHINLHQWKFQDPKMEKLYNICYNILKPYFVGISCYIGLR